MELLGVPVYISDNETRALMVEDEQIRSGLIGMLGKEVYVSGMLNKPLLASYIFSDVIHAAKVNALVHPRVKEDFRRWVTAIQDKQAVGIESAILLEAGFRDEVDIVVMVYAPEEVRIARAMQRDKLSREAIVQRIRSQMKDEEKRKKADEIIVNDGVVPVLPQVINLLQKLLL
ncbi:dephospho-CoA kinase [gut metagenome]|uniref:Dephospho-CoA kinase n=1 Tax=gut metagenome TaxID=749906 RepID=J9C5P8_9ZZZZ